MNELLGKTDIYIIDQIMKGRYKPADVILDAGCGDGRNLYWFILQNFNIHGVDIDETAIRSLIRLYPHYAENFIVVGLESTPYVSDYFDHILSSAVLHFAKSTTHFHQMFSEHTRILKKGGSLLIRMCSDIGIETKVKSQGSGVFKIPDGSIRFLLTRDMIKAICPHYNLGLIEPVKTTNVNDLRSMTTLVLRKK